MGVGRSAVCVDRILSLTLLFIYGGIHTKHKFYGHRCIGFRYSLCKNIHFHLGIYTIKN